MGPTVTRLLQDPLAVNSSTTDYTLNFFLKSLEKSLKPKTEKNSILFTNTNGTTTQWYENWTSNNFLFMLLGKVKRLFSNETGFQTQLLGLVLEKGTGGGIGEGNWQQVKTGGLFAQSVDV